MCFIPNKSGLEITINLAGSNETLGYTLLDMGGFS